MGPLYPSAETAITTFDDGVQYPNSELNPGTLPAEYGRALVWPYGGYSR
jgi:hypothetical protein